MAKTKKAGRRKNSTSSVKSKPPDFAEVLLIYFDLKSAMEVVTYKGPQYVGMSVVVVSTQYL